MKIYEEKTRCRICGGTLKVVLDMGEIYMNDFVDNDANDVPKVPLVLCVCSMCELVQLKHTVDHAHLYEDHYWYRSKLNASMVKALEDVVVNIKQRIQLLPGDTVIDIGANDGTLMSFYEGSLLRIGFDPAVNLAREARKHCAIFHNTYFGNRSIPTPEAKVITSIAMFYDLDDPRHFIELIKESLHKEGMWVIQLTDLLSMLRINAFDNICSEHLEYYSFKVLKRLLQEHGLEVFDIQTNSVNGGSIRVYAAHPGVFKVHDAVQAYLDEELAYMQQWLDPFIAFAERCNYIKHTVVRWVMDAIEQRKTVYVMGASTKGSTTLQWFGLDRRYIQYAAEINEDKFGKVTSGTGIHIIPEDEAMAKQPDYFLLLPWHFKDNILAKNTSYRYRGGRYIIPCPNPEII